MHRSVGFAFVVPLLTAVLIGACEPSAHLDSPAPAPASGSPAPSASVRVYFYLGGEPGSEGLVPVERTVAGVDPVAGALAALLAGPTGAESGERQISSAIPGGSRVLGLSVAGGVATLDLSREYESGGGSLSMSVRLGQVVYTLTQFPEIEAVAFRVEGRPVTVFSGEGIVLDHAQTRADSEGVLPAIFVDRPAYGGLLGNPGGISGTANVVEAQFRVTLLDASGATIADVPATASCGTGCRGTFEVTVPYAVDEAQTGTLRVWDGSIRGGRPINVREYPVGLVPAD